jgi:hypothetical protein
VRLALTCRARPRQSCIEEDGTSGLRFFEKVFVHALDDVGFPVLHADVMGHHKLRQRDAVDENDTGGYPVGVGDGLVSEAARGDKDPAVNLCTVQGADESLNFWAADSVRGSVPLGLHVNLVQAERVLPDDAVQAVIAGSAQVLSRSGRATVSHGRQDIQDEPFQERWLTFSYAFEDFRRNGIVSLRDRIGDGLPGRGLCGCRRVLRIGFRRAGVTACPAPELDELLELEQDADVHLVWMSGQHVTTAVSDLDNRTARPTNQAGLVQVSDGPVQAVSEQRRPARQGRFQVLVG